MLNFLNPTVLFALAAAAIPLLIHLFNRRKIKQISFSTIHFLKKLEKKQMRNLRIRQLLLLILRTLIMVFLILAFARPTLKSGAGSLLAERTPIEAVILLDNSLSLNEVQMTGTLLKELQQSFDDLQTVFQIGDRITVLQATDPLKELTRQENYQAGLWERVKRKLQPNYLKSNLHRGIISAVELLRQSPYYNREIYIISDFQKSALSSEDVTQVREQVERNNIRVFAIPISHHNLENISVDSVEVVNRLIEKNQVLKLETFLNNHHPNEHLTTMASVLLNGKRVAQRNITLESQKVSQAPFQLTLTENGFVEGEVQIESDGLIEDNRRFFNFYVPKKIRILHFLPDGNSNSYIPFIIRPAESRGIFEYSSDVQLKWSDYDFRDFDIVIIENLRELPANFRQRLKNFSEQGGGVVIIPGENLVLPRYQEFLQDMGLGTIIELKGTPGEKDQFLTLTGVQWENTIFEGLFESREKQFGPIEVYSGYRVRPAPEAETLISLSDGSPFLLLRKGNRGTTMFFASALHTDWTELPVKGFVVPLTYRSIYYMGTRKVVDRISIRSGETFRQRFTDLEPPFDFKLKAAGEEEIKLTPEFRGADVLLKIENTEQPGNYRILHNDQTLTVFSVNPWKEESQMVFYSEKELNSILSNLLIIADRSAAEQLILQSRFGKELWKHFLLIAIILLFLEMVIARTGSKKEFVKSEVQEMALRV